MESVYQEVMLRVVAKKKIEVDDDFFRKMEEVFNIEIERLMWATPNYVEATMDVCQETMNQKRYVEALNHSLDFMSRMIDRSGVIPHYAALCCETLLDLYCKKPATKPKEVQDFYRFGIAFCNKAISWGGNGEMFYATRGRLENHMKNYKNACRDNWIASICGLHKDLRVYKSAMYELTAIKLKSFLKEISTRNYFLTSRYMNFWMAIGRNNIILRDMKEVSSGKNTIKASGYQKALQALAKSRFREVTLHLLIAVEREAEYRAECYLLLARIFLPSRHEAAKYFGLLKMVMDAENYASNLERFDLLVQAHECLRIAMSLDSKNWVASKRIKCMDSTMKAEILTEAAFMRLGLEKAPGLYTVKEGELCSYREGIKIVFYNAQLLMEVFNLCEDAVTLDQSWAIPKILKFYTNLRMKYWLTVDKDKIKNSLRLAYNEADLETLFQWSAFDIAQSGNNAYLADYVLFELLKGKEIQTKIDIKEAAAFLLPKLPYVGSVELFYRLFDCHEMDAVSVLETFLKKDPDNFDAQLKLYIALHNEKKFEKAVDHLKHAVKLFPYDKSVSDLTLLAHSCSHTEQYIYLRNTLKRCHNDELLEELKQWTVFVGLKLDSLCNLY